MFVRSGRGTPWILSIRVGSSRRPLLSRKRTGSVYTHNSLYVDQPAEITKLSIPGSFPQHTYTPTCVIRIVVSRLLLRIRGGYELTVASVLGVITIPPGYSLV